jgi:Fur family transcriptional regulator, ferric uptake regulator
MSTVKDILAALAKRGLRPTIARNAIVEQVVVLGKAEDGFTCDELVQALKHERSETGRATVFRTIDILRTYGFLDRIAFFDGAERYHLAEPGKHHHHLTCVHCHRVVDIEECPLPNEVSEIADHAGFSLSAHRLDLFGCCQDCRKKGLCPPDGHN